MNTSIDLFSAELKLGYWREGLDRHEAHYLAPHDWNGDLTSDSPKGMPIAHVQPHYSMTRGFRRGGGEGDSRPDSFKAYVRDVALGRDRSLGNFHSMREAKRVIALALRDKSGATPRIDTKLRTIEER